MEITLLYFDGCPNWQTTLGHLQSLEDELGFSLRLHNVSTASEAEEIGFVGSPTVLIDGRDPFATGETVTGLACRVYETQEGPGGTPTIAELRAVLA